MCWMLEAPWASHSARQRRPWSCWCSRRYVLPYTCVSVRAHHTSSTCVVAHHVRSYTAPKTRLAWCCSAVMVRAAVVVCSFTPRCHVLTLDPATPADTENELNEELGGYEHVKVTRNLDVPTVDLLRAIPAIAGGSVDGDCIDARTWGGSSAILLCMAQLAHLVRHWCGNNMRCPVLVGLDMLKKQSAKAKSTKRRIFLVTAAAGAIEDADQMPMIVQQLREMDCKLDVVYVC